MKKIFFLCLVILMPVMAGAQNTMEVFRKSGGSVVLPVNAITKITFTSTNMVIGGPGNVIAISDIQKITFNVVESSVLSSSAENLKRIIGAKIYPNPFNPTANIQFEMPVSGKLTVEVYNGLGQKVRTLFNGNKAAGNHSLMWDGRNDKGAQLGSGAYIMHIATPGGRLNKVLIMAK